MQSAERAAGFAHGRLMDPSVIRAMTRWPDVPAVYGWLSLDRRGRWCLRGEPITHRGVVDFIGRNYACTADGRWFFQNGPQRVYVDLDYTPWVFHLDGFRDLVDHVGNRLSRIREAWIDEEGNLLLVGERGVGLVCDRDLEPVSERLCHEGGEACDEDDVAGLIAPPTGTRPRPIYLEWRDARIALGRLCREQVPARFGFEPAPRADDHAC